MSRLILFLIISPKQGNKPNKDGFIYKPRKLNKGYIKYFKIIITLLSELHLTLRYT